MQVKWWGRRFERDLNFTRSKEPTQGKWNFPPVGVHSPPSSANQQTSIRARSHHHISIFPAQNHPGNHTVKLLPIKLLLNPQSRKVCETTWQGWVGIWASQDFGAEGKLWIFQNLVNTMDDAFWSYSGNNTLLPSSGWESDSIAGMPCLSEAVHAFDSLHKLIPFNFSLNRFF